MQMGLNTDLIHQGKTLHIQTEDVASPQGYIITHLFLAGSILASQRLDYEEGLIPEELKALIRTQHHGMIRAVQAGEYNRKLLLHRPRSNQSSFLPLASKRKLERREAQEAQEESEESEESEGQV